MREWLTAQEIADAQLPGLPATRKGIAVLADREGWNDGLLSRRRDEKGGGTEYHLRRLPALAQAAYRALHTIVGSEEPPKPASGDDFRLVREKLRFDARYAVVEAFVFLEGGQNGQKLNRQACEKLFVDRYNAGRLAIAPWVRKVVKKLSVRTLARWRTAATRGTFEKIVDGRYKGRLGTGWLDRANGGSVRDFLVGLIAHQPHLSADQVRTQCRAEFGDTLLTGPWEKDSRSRRFGPFNSP